MLSDGVPFQLKHSVFPVTFEIFVIFAIFEIFSGKEGQEERHENVTKDEKQAEGRRKEKMMVF